MNTNEILEGNKLIAEFIGFVLNYIDEEKTMPYYIHNEKYLSNPPSTILLYKGEELKYHSSWDWLIPCVDKIYDMDEYSEYKQTLSIFNGGVEINTKFIISTFKDVLVFIEWYNLNNK